MPTPLPRNASETSRNSRYALAPSTKDTVPPSGCHPVSFRYAVRTAAQPTTEPSHRATITNACPSATAPSSNFTKAASRSLRNPSRSEASRSKWICRIEIFPNAVSGVSPGGRFPIGGPELAPPHERFLLGIQRFPRVHPISATIHCIARRRMTRLNGRFPSKMNRSVVPYSFVAKSACRLAGKFTGSGSEGQAIWKEHLHDFAVNTTSTSGL